MKNLKSGNVIDIFKTTARDNLLFPGMVVFSRKIFVSQKKQVLILVAEQRSGYPSLVREILGLFSGSAMFHW